MPNAMNMLGLPQFNGTETTEEKVDRIQNYLFMHLEELRYILHNLGTENFNGAALNELSDFVAKNIKAETIVSNTIVTNNLITNELYSKYGEISDLVVWQLRTDYMKIRNYQQRITDDVNYQYIRDEKLEFLTDSVILPAQAEQLIRGEKAFYWKDPSETDMTFEEVTPWPVMVYKYRTLTKASLRFEEIELDDDQHTITYAPRLTLGAGDEFGNSRGYIFKNQHGLELKYTKTMTGEERKVYLNENGVSITKPILDDSSYGTLDPITAGISGVNGQLYFQLYAGAWVYSSGWKKCFAEPPEGGEEI